MLGKFKRVKESTTATKMDVAMVPINPKLVWFQIPRAKMAVAIPKTVV